MKFLRKFVLSAFLLSAFGAVASTRSISEAQQIASKALKNASVATFSNAKVVNGDTAYYVFKGDNGGYALVSANKNVPGLLGYSNAGDADNLPSDVMQMLDAFAAISVNNHNLNAENANSEKSNGLKVTRIVNKAVAPLLNDIVWGQREPFNYTTPVIEDEHTPTGCVATAIAQVMCYYRYPAAVLADIPQYTTKTKGFAIPGVKAGTAIDWKNIINNYEEGFTSEQGSAISNLLTIVGTAAEMDYKANESTCTKICAEELVNNFGYDKDLIRVAYRSTYTFEEWSNIILNELVNKRPVLMSGSTMNSGHRFVVDGIDNAGLFHVNWGWNGRYDGYYDLTVLNPNTTTEAGASSSSDGYSKDNYIVYGIVPDNGKVDVNPSSPKVDALSVRHQSSGGVNYLFFKYANVSLQDLEILLASGYIDEDGNVVKIADIGKSSMKTNLTYSQQNAYGLDVSGFEEGKIYKVGLLESTDGKTWSPSNGFNNVSVSFTVKDGKVMVIGNYQLSADVDLLDFNEIRQYAHGVIHLKNTGSKEYYERLYIMTSSENACPNGYSYAANVTAEANESNDIDFKFVPVSDTVYYWLKDYEMNVLASGYWVRGNKKFHLEANAVMETLANGDQVFRLNVKNDGEAFYDNVVRAVVFRDGGYKTITSHVYLKPGDETNVSTVIADSCTYTHYTVYDYNADQFSSGNFEGSSTDGEVKVSMVLSKLEKAGDELNGSLIVNNNTSEVYKTTYNIEIDTVGQFSGDLYMSIDVDVEPNTVANIPFTIVVNRDSFYVVYYEKGPTLRHSQKVVANNLSSVPSIFADLSVLKVWTEGSSLVIEATEDASFVLSNINGKIIMARSLQKGEIYRKSLSSGVYLLNRKKVIIR